MRLNNVQELSHIRNFTDFKSSKEFEKKVIIYAPNGSGKTNITRLLQYLKDPGKDLDELKSQEAQAERLSFSISIDGKEISEKNYHTEDNQELLKRVLIFNCDFVEENINCDDFSDKQTDGDVQVELGREDNELRDAKNKWVSLFNKRIENFKVLREELAGVKERLVVDEKKYSGNEQNIWKELDIEKIIIPNEFRPNESYINFLKSEVQTELYTSCESDLKQTKELDSADKIIFNQSIRSSLDMESIKNLLITNVTLPEPDQQTENNLKFLKQWLTHDLLAYGKTEKDVLSKAIELSETEHIDKCILCKRDLDKATKELFKNYKDYFKGEKAIFESSINQHIRSLAELEEELGRIDGSLKTSVDKYVSLFDLDDQWTDIQVSSVNEEIQKVIGLLKKKIDNPATSIELQTELSSGIEVLKAQVKSNSDLCLKINRRIENAQQRSSALRRQVGQKYLHEFVVNHEAQFLELNSVNEELEASQELVKQKEKAAPQKSARVHVKNLFNLFLNEKIGITKYEADILNDQIVIKLNKIDISQSTNKISEGEKTMMGLCYFFASSIFTLDSTAKLEEAVFIVDDPVSSTSYGNFFGISDLIQNFEQLIRSEVWPQETKDLSIQKLILTHNIQLFNLLRTHVFKPIKSNTNYFILQDSDFKAMSPKGLLSEFQTSLSRIHRKSEDLTYDVNVGNDMRRVLETIRHFYGLGDFDKDTIQKVFPHTNKLSHKDFFQMVNYYSHGNSEEGLDPLPPEVIDRAVSQFIEIISDEGSPFKSLWESTVELSKIDV